MNNLIELLRNGGTPEMLATELGIKAKAHPAYPNLLQFNYSQIDSPKYHPLVNNCRGIILDRDSNWSPVAWPFDRFYNHGEPGAAYVDWSSAVVYEKLDGSLVIMYFYDGKWHFATRGTPDAECPVGDFGFNFRHLISDAWGNCGYAYPWAWTSSTFMFELTSQYNRVVVPYVEPTLRLIGIRTSLDGLEVAPETLTYRAPRSYSLGSAEDCIAALQDLNGIETEGYVVRDGSFNRVKIKSPSYVALHHLRDGFGLKRLAELIRLGEGQEFLSYFPEFKADHNRLAGNYAFICGILDGTYQRIRGIESQKEFALEALKTPCPAALFNMRKGRVSRASEHLAEMQLDSFVELINKC